MEPDWIKKIDKFEVEREEIPRPNQKPYLLNASSLIGILHTTEISTVDKTWKALSAKSVAPHFICGESRIVQCRPLSVQGSALRPGPKNSANVHAQVQIEMVAFSKQKLWLPDDGTLLPAVSIMAYCQRTLGIPLRVPSDWPDDCSDLKNPWASNNKRRRQAVLGIWPKEKGWWMHLEVPYQGPTWHWDCGAIQRSAMLDMAKKLI